MSFEENSVLILDPPSACCVTLRQLPTLSWHPSFSKHLFQSYHVPNVLTGLNIDQDLCPHRIHSLIEGRTINTSTSNQIQKYLSINHDLHCRGIEHPRVTENNGGEHGGNY